MYEARLLVFRCVVCLALLFLFSQHIQDTVVAGRIVGGVKILSLDSLFLRFPSLAFFSQVPYQLR